MHINNSYIWLNKIKILKFQTSCKNVFILVLLLGLTFPGLQAQEAIPASGGNVTGSGGTVSYSIGQVFYLMNSGATGSVLQGVQQPHEIFGKEDTTGCFIIDAFVYLEGALIVAGGTNYGSEMRTDLNIIGILPGQSYADPIMGTINYTPAGQPYNIAPWNYTGTEGTLFDSGGNPANGKAGYPSSVVDWVLVSLRDKADATAITLCKAAALLHNDGHIEFVGGGFSCCELDPENKYYLVVEHRNHLIIMSDALPVVGGKIICDFRTQQSYIDPIWGPDFFAGQKPVTLGRYAMYAGNGDQIMDSASDTDITSDDRTWWESFNGKPGKYLSGDYDLNADCTMDDRSVWEKNNGNFTSVPRN